MALWGNQDNLTGPTPVTVVGTASSDFWTVSASGMSASGVSTEGNTVLLSVLGSGDESGSAGFLTLEAELATDLYRVGKMSGIGTEVLGVNFDATYCDQPISLKNDPGYAPSSADGNLGRTQVVAGIATAGIDALEPTGTAGTITTLAGGIHAGWVGIMTYVDMHGELRTKTETFVAASGIQTGNRPYPTA
jgi:hypothetical protein